MKGNALDARHQLMLELLAEGASARIVARKLGYSEGTTRVYLHNLYRAIGVRNKTEAVIWHLGRVRREEMRHAAAPAAAPALPPAAVGATVGEMALAEDLYTALGVMSSFLGPFGHLWEAGYRLKGGQLDEKALARRAQARLLWRALLRGDFAYGKALYDEGVVDRLLQQDGPSEALLVACLLWIGGYSGAAARISSSLGDKRKGAAALGAREAALVRALHDGFERHPDAGIAALGDLAQESARAPLVRQLAMAALFHACRAARDTERAQRAADALWNEAESARQQLEAMGIRPLTREAAAGRAAKPAAATAAAARAKATASR
jgi:Bacterial regulatory proteins, luxR family